LSAMVQRNWMRRDVLIKQQLGFDDAYWRRAAEVLRLSERAARDTGAPPVRMA
jgi:hypothetical protein